MKIVGRSFRRRAVIFVSVVFSLTLFNHFLVKIDWISTDQSPISYLNCPGTDSYWQNLFDSNHLMSGNQIMDYFKWTNRSSCDLIQYFGGFLRGYPSGKDGIKAVCLDPKIIPNPNDCLVYSFGINIDWTFDEDMERFGCDVYCFDPSINRTHHDHKPYIHFFNWGLGHFDGYGNGLKSGWELHTLSYIYDKLSKYHDTNRTIDYLKLDIEGDEWNVIPQLIQSGMLSKVRQLGIEIHLNASDSIDNIRRQVKLLRSLESAGMVRFDSMYNPWIVSRFANLNVTSSTGWDISFYNTKFVVPSQSVFG